MGIISTENRSLKTYSLQPNASSLYRLQSENHHTTTSRGYLLILALAGRGITSRQAIKNDISLTYCAHV